jgi:hypothetical protein
MTTTEIRTLLADLPDWLVAEREKHAPGTGRPPGTAVGERPAESTARTPKPLEDDEIEDDEIEDDEIDDDEVDDEGDDAR